MHSQLHDLMYRAESVDRARRAPRAAAPVRRPAQRRPVRGRAAYAAAWLTGRLDAGSARRPAA
jgi:hypothetical protein